MGFELPNGKTARNLQEQVKFLSEKLKDLYAAVNEIGIKVLVVDELPEEGELLTIYFVPAEDASQENIYNEYMWIEDEWELIGSTEIDLSDYMTLSTNQTVSGEKTFTTDTYFTGNPHFNTTAYLSECSCYGSLYSVGNLDLGSASYKWQDLYLSDGIIFKYGTIGTIDWKLEVGGDYSFGFVRDNVNLISYITTQGFGFNGDVYSQNNQDLGKSASKWKDLYLSGKLYFNNNYIYEASNVIKFYINTLDRFELTQNTLKPVYDGQLHLGALGQRIGDIYLSGNITDGTNSVSVADLAALITYAKGQGWIS